MNFLFFILFSTSIAHAQQTSVFRAFETPFNNPWTLHIQFDPPIVDNPAVRRVGWINCPREDIVNPDYEIRIQDFDKVNSDPLKVKAYKIMPYQERSPRETCLMIRHHLDSDRKNRIEVLLNTENETATLVDLFKGSYRDL